MTLPRSLSGLPDLEMESLMRIQVAYERTLTLLLDGIDRAWRQFIIKDDCATPRTASVPERIEALQSAQQNELNAKITANLHLFDAIDAEYLSIDRDQDAHVDRLQKVVLPAVRTTFAFLDMDKLLFEALLARLMTRNLYVDPESSKSTEAPRKRGRPPLNDELKMQALEKRRTAEQIGCARILYQTNHPTQQQVKNVPSILKNYTKTLSFRTRESGVNAEDGK